MSYVEKAICNHCRLLRLVDDETGLCADCNPDLQDEEEVNFHLEGDEE